MVYYTSYTTEHSVLLYHLGIGYHYIFTNNCSIITFKTDTNKIVMLLFMREMSGWDAWVQQLLRRNVEDVTHVSAHHGGLFGFDGKLWAGTSTFVKTINPAFIKKMHDAIDHGASRVSKIDLGGKKYYVIKNDTTYKFVILKSVVKGAGCTVAKSNTCFIVGVYDNDQVQPANNTSQICDIRDHLVDVGY